MRWKCRLEGGPYDGDAGNWVHELPDRFWVFRCPECKDIHWADFLADAPLSAIAYDYDRMETEPGHVAVYVHADSDLSDLPVLRDCIVTPSAA